MTQTRQGERRSCVHLLSLPCASNVLRCSLCFYTFVFWQAARYWLCCWFRTLGVVCWWRLLLPWWSCCYSALVCVCCSAHAFPVWRFWDCMLGSVVPQCVLPRCFVCSFIFGKTFSACISFTNCFVLGVSFDISLSAGTCDAGEHLQRKEILGFV